MKQRLLLMVLVLVSLAGCATYVQPPFELVASSLQVTNIKTDIDAQAVRHYAWSECVSGLSGCRVMYKRFKLHQEVASLELLAPDNREAYLSDLATLADGTSILVFRAYPGPALRGIADAVDYVVTIPAVITDTPTPVRLPAAGVLSAGDLPVLARNATIAYAVYTQVSATGTDLFARQMAPTAEAAFALSSSVDKTVHGPVAAVDLDGRLHVGFNYYSTLSDYRALFYARKAPAEMLYITPFEQGAPADWPYYIHNLAVDQNDNAFIVYVESAEPEDQIAVYRHNLDNTSNTIAVLDGTSGLQWNIADRVQIKVVGTLIYVGFVAQNINTGADSEVWLQRDNQNNPPTLEQLTDDTVSQQKLVMAQDFIVAMAWRDYPSNLVAQRVPDGAACAAQVHTWDSLDSKVRDYTTPIITDCGLALDLEVNAENSFTMAWDQASQADPTQVIPWASFNSEGVALPVVRR